MVIIVCFVLWYRKNHSNINSPRWDVVDFQIKDFGSKEGAHSNNADSFLNREKQHHLADDYQAEIDEIKSRPAFQQQQLSYDELQDRIQEFIQWDRPYTDHWPAWHDYDDADYDPNRWEAMDR